jgi:uncharacterized membrane protein YuzA (DUF378 family)
MKALNLITLVLVIIGGIDLGLMGAAHYDFITGLFGANSMLVDISYGIIGLSALWQIVPLLGAVRTSETISEAHARPATR